MRDIIRWALLAAAVLALIGMVAYARGTPHHHGDDIGSHAAAAAVEST
jgi:hypothetical protein